jgi:hypothetical protein
MGLQVTLGEKRTNQIPNFTWTFTAFSTNSHSVKSLKFKHVIKAVVMVVNFTPFHELIIANFHLFSFSDG